MAPRQPAAKPLGSSLLAGLVASLCCGGSLFFDSVGLGALYGALGLSRYVPQVLAVGALSIVTINYWFYCRAAQRTRADPGKPISTRASSKLRSAPGGKPSPKPPSSSPR